MSVSGGARMAVFRFGKCFKLRDTNIPKVLIVLLQVLVLLASGALMKYAIIDTTWSFTREIHVAQAAPSTVIVNTGACNATRRAVVELEGRNILCIFTGRWKFLRVHFPYIYRDLRQNGGVLDKVYYIMIQYDKETTRNLHNLTKAANTLLGVEVFEFRHLNNGGDKQKRPKDAFSRFYYLMFDEMSRNPLNKYFKMDDDIVYIHPGAFRQMIEQHNPSECFLHFGNIVNNWRCNTIHQRKGVFVGREINPKMLKFDYDPHAECGWKRAECAELALNAFLHHRRNHTLDKFLFNGRELTTDRLRFSINMFLLDINLIELEALLKSGPISHDDEHWWTVLYSSHVKHPNCVVGKALFVHFSYGNTMEALLEKNVLKQFEAIVKNDTMNKLPKNLQNLFTM